MDVNSGMIIPLNVSTVKTVTMDVTTGGGGGGLPKNALRYVRIPTKYDLPNVGKENTMYFAVDTYNAYMWDPTQCSYYPVGLTPDNFGIISCEDSTFEMEE